mgnify:CR=1 FL=1
MCNVKKVVLTSSVAAIFETGIEKVDYDENDWSDPDNPKISNYAKSKTLAEKAAWDFGNENKGSTELDKVFDPPVGDDISSNGLYFMF